MTDDCYVLYGMISCMEFGAGWKASSALVMRCSPRQESDGFDMSRLGLKLGMIWVGVAGLSRYFLWGLPPVQQRAFYRHRCL